jgi:hypothetical protein
MYYAVGGFRRLELSAGRIRVTGLLSRGNRGFVLSVKDDAVWVIDADQPIDQLVGEDVVAEGTVIGLDRLKADWIGVATTSGRTVS